MKVYSLLRVISQGWAGPRALRGPSHPCPRGCGSPANTGSDIIFSGSLKVLKVFAQRGKCWEYNGNRVGIWAGEAQNAEDGKCRLVNKQRYFEIPAKYSILGKKSP